MYNHNFINELGITSRHYAASQINQIRLAVPHPPQQHNHVPIPRRLANLLAKLQQPPPLDMEDAQLLLLPAPAIVHILHLQRLGRDVQHPAHGPVFIVEEVARGVLCLCSIRTRLDMQIHALVRRHTSLALGRTLERIDFRLRIRRRRLTRTDSQKPPALLRRPPLVVFRALVLRPQLEFLQRAEARAGRCGSAGPARHVPAVVVFGHAVLEAVAAGAGGAVVGGHARGVDEGFAGVFEALLVVGVERGFGRQAGGGRGILGGALTRPQAGLGAFVRVFGAVVEAVCSGGLVCVDDLGEVKGGVPATAFTAKWEEVEDVAVFHLAVRPDGFHVAALHLGEAFWSHGRGARVKMLYQLRKKLTDLTTERKTEEKETRK